MTAKEYLNSIRNMTLKINQKKRELDDLRAQTPGMTGTASGERVQSSRSNDPVGIYAAKIADLEEKIEREKADMIEKRHVIINQIQEIENPVFVDILFRRYVLNQRFDQIADDMGYSVRHIIRMHGHALQMFERCHLMSV